MNPLKKFKSRKIAPLVISAFLLAACRSEPFHPMATNFSVMDITAVEVSDLPWNEQLKFESDTVSFFTYVETEHGAFAMDTSNFDMIDGERAWEIHEQLYLSGEFDHFWPSAFCHSGRTIAVTPNYFLHNTIETVEGGNVVDQLVRDATTLNILVPESLKGYEEEIIAAHRWSFWFNKIDVENIYNEFLDHPINETEEEDLTIHIIYVKDNQSYFTFNPRIEAENDFVIIDPIVQILFPETFHPAQMRSIVQRGVFLPGSDWIVDDFETGREDMVITRIRELD